MKSVTVHKAELLGIVRANRDRHEEEYNKAHLIYRDDMLDYLEARQQAAEERLKEELDQIREDREKILQATDGPISGELHNRNYSTPEPEQNLKDYDRAIQMLTLSIDDVLELDEASAKTLVMDDWEWKQEFGLVTASYLSGPKGDAGPRGNAGCVGVRSALTNSTGK